MKSLCRMRNLCWLLIGLAAITFATGTAIAFTHQVFLLEPVGYWRRAMQLWGSP